MEHDPAVFAVALFNFTGTTTALGCYNDSNFTLTSLLMVLLCYSVGWVYQLLRRPDAQEQESLTTLVIASEIPVTQCHVTTEMESRMRAIGEGGPGYFFESEIVNK